jgi:hypothetical protein
MEAHENGGAVVPGEALGEGFAAGTCVAKNKLTAAIKRIKSIRASRCVMRPHGFELGQSARIIIRVPLDKDEENTDLRNL